jgi:hypothetical protein
MSEHKYAMKYRLDFTRGPFTADELRAAAAADPMVGGTDVFVLMSGIRREDGGASHQLATFDGLTGEDVSGDDLYRAWRHLTHVLAEQYPPECKPWAAHVAQAWKNLRAFTTENKG